MTRIMRLLAVAAFMLMTCASVALAGDPDPRWPAGNLLKNAGFENGGNKWTIAGTDGKDKVKCGDMGAESQCAFRFKGKIDAEKTVLKQVITPETAGRGVREAIVANATVWLRPLSGVSCIDATLTVKFNNPAAEKLKGTYSTCNSGGAGIWMQTPDFGSSTSFGENSYKKIVFKIKHTGVGEWLIDEARVEFEAK
jgi:hypothetical protein